MLRYDSRRIVRSRACRGHLCAVDVAVCIRQLLIATALHLLPFRLAAVHSVGVKLYPHTIWVKAAEIDLNFEYVLPLRHSQPSLRRSAAWPISVPECAANRPPARPLHLYQQRAHGRLQQPGCNVLRCTRVRRGWQKTAVSSAPCFHASAPPRQWEYPACCGYKTRGSPRVRADRRAPRLRQHPRTGSSPCSWPSPNAHPTSGV